MLTIKGHMLLVTSLVQSVHTSLLVAWVALILTFRLFSLLTAGNNKTTGLPEQSPPPPSAHDSTLVNSASSVLRSVAMNVNLQRGRYYPGQHVHCFKNFSKMIASLYSAPVAGQFDFHLTNVDIIIKPWTLVYQFHGILCKICGIEIRSLLSALAEKKNSLIKLWQLWYFI